MTSQIRQSAALDRAHYWRARMADPDVSGTERQEFHTWLGADVEHALAYDMADRLWESVGTLNTAVNQREIPNGRSGRVRSHLWALPIAASFAVFVLGISLFLHSTNQSGPSVQPIVEHYATEVGETREIALADGSLVTLGAKTSMDVTFSTDQRQITLSSGDALFTVAKDAGRPFIVTHQDLRVRVTGTVFDMRVSGLVADIAVAEGSVAVSYPIIVPSADGYRTTALLSRAQLSAGDRIAASRETGLGRVNRFDTESLGAWRDAQLAYADAPITEILADADRYTDHDIIIENPEALRRIRLSATFSAENIDRLIETLAYSYDLTLDRVGDGPLTVRPKK
ncbi:MAG: FecR domain-containing protein [Pseudomonadota bacterium]